MKIYIHILVALFGIVLVYLAGSFIAGTFNVFSLSIDARQNMVGFYLLEQLVLQIVCFETLSLKN